MRETRKKKKLKDSQNKVEKTDAPFDDVMKALLSDPQKPEPAKPKRKTKKSKKPKRKVKS